MTDRRSIGLVFPRCDRRGGVERSIRELGLRAAQDADVTFVGDEMDAAGMEAVAFHPVGGRPLPGALAAPSFRWRAGKALERERFDVTVSFGANCPPGDVLWVNSVHWAWLRYGQPVPTPIGAVPNKVRYALPQHQAILALEQAYYRSRRPQRYVAVSEQTADEIIDIFGVDRDRVTIIPNGFAASEFSAERRVDERAARRAAIGLGDDDIVLLLVANELHRKGLATMIDAVAQLGDPRVQIHVVGRAPIEPYREHIASAGLTGRVVWHGPSDDVGGWLTVGDLFVMPTQYEAYPLVVVESLASGLPVITTAVAGSKDAIRPGVNGLLLQDPMDASELARLLDVGLDAATRAAWSVAAPGSVAHLEWTHLARRFREVVDQVT